MTMAEPDTYCRNGNPVVWGYFGFSTHTCSDCISSFSKDELLLVMVQCHKDHARIPVTYESHSCEHDFTETVTYPAEQVGDEFFEEWTDTTTYHPLSPEQVKVINVIMLSEPDEWHNDVILELLYAEGSEFAGRGATYGYNSETREASCYAD